MKSKIDNKEEPGKELVNITSYQLGKLIEQTMQNLPQTPADNTISCRVDGLEIEIIFKIKKS